MRRRGWTERMRETEYVERTSLYRYLSAYPFSARVQSPHVDLLGSHLGQVDRPPSSRPRALLCLSPVVVTVGENAGTVLDKRRTYIVGFQSVVGHHMIETH